ncbi:hypothetical protein BT96DRAFT_638535 [Gymnopus androsaceus JB14]|uniref:Uncharacterized protein n=1 Tax=Gymnopus androsaceus JB14 TaxID=1447944 RepID=A0A6A4HUM6_9AGAR|nr:hypothetical protein BT96DRAFT_638535 [Gymnopus androsaceus JB14]
MLPPMLPPSTRSRTQGPTSPTAFTSPMGPPPQPSHPHPPPSAHPIPGPSAVLPPVTSAPSSEFASRVQQIRSLTSRFYTPRTDCYYDYGTHVLQATLELPGVRRENVLVTLADSAINRCRGLSVWGFSVSPILGVRGNRATAGTSSAEQGASSMTGTTIHSSSGSLSSSSSYVYAPPSSSAMRTEAAGSAGAPGWSGVSAAPDTRDPNVTPAMLESLGFGLPAPYTSRERKYGEFYRLLPVPPDTRVRFHLHSLPIFLFSMCLSASLLLLFYSLCFSVIFPDFRSFSFSVLHRPRMFKRCSMLGSCGCQFRSVNR